MSAVLIAERYARAMTVAIEDDARLERVLSDIEAFSESYAAQPELRGVLESPAVPPRRRREIFSALLERTSGDEASKKLLLALLERGRIVMAPQVAAALRRHVDRRLNRARAHVTSAGDLSEGQLARIRAGLERRSGKTIELDTSRDPELLGGVVVELNGTVIDGSLRTRLDRLKSALLEEESA